MRKCKFLLALLLLASGAWAQTRQLTGNVKDSKSGNLLPSVTLKIKGQKKATTTDGSGNFSLMVPSGKVSLEVSTVGYGSKSVIVEANENNILISLDQSSAQLSEVVVTALGINKEARKVGYSVTTVNGDQLSKARETNVALSLEGQVAGLNVHGTSGGPGGSARILLRGMPSINSGGSPLFVINGVPIDNTQRGQANEWGGADQGDGIGNINPDDIETMTVLKGQAASALYGTRASNGVIMITTKKGKKGDPTIEYGVNGQWDKPVDNSDYQYVYGQGLNGAKPTDATGALNTNRYAWGAKLDGSPTIQFDGKQYAYSPYKQGKNISNFYRVAPSLTNTVAVSGGGDRGTFRLSVSDLDNSSIVRNSGLNRKTINLNLDQKVTDKLGVALTANYIDESDHNKSQLSDGPGNPNNFSQLATNVNNEIFRPGYDSKGNEVVFSDDNFATNPWFAEAKWKTNTGRKRLITSIAPKYNLTDWLYVSGRVGYDLENDKNFSVTPSGTNYSLNAQGQSGSITLGNTQTSELNLDALLGLSHHLTKDINLDALLGATQRTNQSEYEEINGGPFVIPNLYTPSNVVNSNRKYGYYKTQVSSGYYSLDFTYKNFLTLTTTGRLDAFSTLPKGNRTIFTPSVSGSFLFTDLVKIPALTYGKLRASFAQASGELASGQNSYGISLAGAYQDATYYSVSNAINGIPTGSISSQLPNLFLKPFTVDETEVGTELKFFNNRLGLDVAYYSKTTHHEIQNASISNSTGYGSTVVGTGSVQNKGLEVLLTGSPIKTKDFSWDISLNFTTVKTVVLQTDENGKNLNQGNYRPLNANTAFVKGLSGPQILAHDYTYDAKGNIVVDGSGLPIASTGLLPFGSVLPKVYGGLKNDFTYKNVNLSFLIDYNYGNKVLSATSYYTIIRGLNKITLPGRETGITTGVTSSGAANTVAAGAQSYYTAFANVSRNNVLNGDFIKLRQVVLGYTFTGKTLGNIPLFRAINLSLVGRNLWTIKKNTPNIDPESGFASSVKYAGIEGTSLPTSRTFGISANFKFKN